MFHRSQKLGGRGDGAQGDAGRYDATKLQDMRPITLLPEFGKMAARLLATRINASLVEHPRILHKHNVASSGMAPCHNALQPC